MCVCYSHLCVCLHGCFHQAEEVYDEASGATVWVDIVSEVTSNLLYEICTDALADVRTKHTGAVSLEICFALLFY